MREVRSVILPVSKVRGGLIHFCNFFGTFGKILEESKCYMDVAGSYLFKSHWLKNKVTLERNNRTYYHSDYSAINIAFVIRGPT